MTIENSTTFLLQTPIQAELLKLPGWKEHNIWLIQAAFLALSETNKHVAEELIISAASYKDIVCQLQFISSNLNAIADWIQQVFPNIEDIPHKLPEGNEPPEMIMNSIFALATVNITDELILQKQLYPMIADQLRFMTDNLNTIAGWTLRVFRNV